MARTEDAHLDVLCLGVDRTQMGYYYAGANALIIQETLDRAEEDAKAIVERVTEKLKNEGVRFATEKAVVQIATMSRLVSARARFVDAVILRKPYGEGRSIEHEAIVEAALFDGNASVIIVPEAAEIVDPPQRIVIGWNESAEAMAAVRAALPMLKKAGLVSITIIDPPQHGPDRSDPGGALSTMLSRHGIKAEVTVLAKTMPRVSDVLLRHVTDENADMLVMGAYGHSRFREAIMGGATRDLLEKAKVPVFLAH
jgi:nucleotide-binding universal stress UspA family protein